MLTFTIRRLVLAVPTLLFISLVIFGLLQLAPGDPMAQVPLTVPPEVKEKMREALGLGDAWYIQFWKWIVQFFWVEPQVLVDRGRVSAHSNTLGGVILNTWDSELWNVADWYRIDE